VGAEVLRRFPANGDQERLTREASYLHARTRRSGDGDEPGAWADALVRAAEKIESDRSDAACYAVIAATPTDEDREWDVLTRPQTILDPRPKGQLELGTLLLVGDALRYALDI
jgi:hypothetical protein